MPLHNSKTENIKATDNSNKKKKYQSQCIIPSATTAPSQLVRLCDEQKQTEKNYGGNRRQAGEGT